MGGNKKEERHGMSCKLWTIDWGDYTWKSESRRKNEDSFSSFRNFSWNKTKAASIFTRFLLRNKYTILLQYFLKKRDFLIFAWCRKENSMRMFGNSLNTTPCLQLIL